MFLNSKKLKYYMGFIGAIKRFSRLRIIIELLIREGFDDVIGR